MGERLVRVRVGSKAAAKPVANGKLEPFARVPYKFRKPEGKAKLARRAREAAVSSSR